MKTGRLRALPDFLIIGAQRAGTSSLYNYLIQSPFVLPALKKEVHFFDDGFEHGLDWYRAHFALSAHQRLLKRMRGVCRIGEASPYYILHPHAPSRIRETLPTVKLIILLRNPVDRAESHYHHQRRRGRETLSFEEAIESESERLHGEMEKMLVDPTYVSMPHRKFSYITRGRYIEQLPIWYELFAPEQLYVLRSEDLFSDPAAAVSAVITWLGIPEYHLDPFKSFNRATYTKMNPGTRERLVRYFKPYNQRLNEFLGRDMKWDD